MPRPLLFTLNRISQPDVQALQFALRAGRLLQPAFMRQRLRAFGGRLVPDLPVNRPWSATSSRFGIIDVPTLIPSVVHQLFPYPNPPTRFKLAGVTRDSTGAVLGGCVVKVYRTSDDLCVGSTTSDANGTYVVPLASSAETYYARYYLAGSPDRAGTSKNGLDPA